MHEFIHFTTEAKAHGCEAFECNPYPPHWQATRNGIRVDVWPTTNRFRLSTAPSGEKARIGPPKTAIAALLDTVLKNCQQPEPIQQLEIDHDKYIRDEEMKNALAEVRELKERFGRYVSAARAILKGDRRRVCDMTPDELLVLSDIARLAKEQEEIQF